MEKGLIIFEPNQKISATVEYSVVLAALGPDLGLMIITLMQRGSYDFAHFFAHPVPHVSGP